MGRPLLVRGARQLVTLHGPDGPRRGGQLNNPGLIPDGSVLIIDGVIQEVGPTRRIENLVIARDADEIDASGRVVMPGFVDSHTHLVSGSMVAGNPADRRAAASAQIESSSRKALQSRAEALILDCVRHGTTTIEAKSGYGRSETGELKILRTQVALNQQPIEVVSTFMPPREPGGQMPESASDYVDWLCR